MKLVLSSFGLGVEAVTEKIVEFVGKPADKISVAIINEAHSVDDTDKRWQIDQLHRCTQTFGGMIRIVNLLALDIAEIEKRLTASDVIFCLGGNTFWLKTVFERSGFEKILPKLLDKKVWFGQSAGSIILGKVATYREQFRKKDYYKGDVTKFYRIVDCHIIPHVGISDDPKYKFETCIEESKRQSSPVYALSDEGALVVDGEKMYMIGKNCHKIENGKIMESI